MIKIERKDWEIIIDNANHAIKENMLALALNRAIHDMATKELDKYPPISEVLPPKRKDKAIG